MINVYKPYEIIIVVVMNVFIAVVIVVVVVVVVVIITITMYRVTMHMPKIATSKRLGILCA